MILNITSIGTKKGKKIYYKGTQLLGHTYTLGIHKGKFISPEEMLGIHEFYEKQILRGAKGDKSGFYEARRKERLEKHPKIWLNSVISKLIMEKRNNGLAKKLVNEFRDRGFSEVWLEDKNLKGTNE